MTDIDKLRDSWAEACCLPLASRIGRALLIGLAAYVVIVAGWYLWTRHTQEFSLPGFIVTLLAIPIMRYLARRNIELANQLGSRALRADAMASLTCGWLSIVAVVSLGAQAVSGIWWIDSAGSLAISRPRASASVHQGAAP